MAKNKGAARQGNGKKPAPTASIKAGATGDAAGNGAADDAMDTDRVRPEPPPQQGRRSQDADKNARMAVWNYWLGVCKQMLKIAGFKKWSCEPAGDCSFVALMAGYEIDDEDKAKRLDEGDRRRLVNKKLREGGVQLLSTGKPPDGALCGALSDDERDLVAQRFNVHSLSRVRQQAVRPVRTLMTVPPHSLHLLLNQPLLLCQVIKKSLASWLRAGHYGANNYAMLAAASMILDRPVCLLLKRVRAPWVLINSRDKQAQVSGHARFELACRSIAHNEYADLETRSQDIISFDHRWAERQVDRDDDGNKTVEYNHTTDYLHWENMSSEKDFLNERVDRNEEEEEDEPTHGRGFLQFATLIVEVRPLAPPPRHSLSHTFTRHLKTHWQCVFKKKPVSFIEHNGAHTYTKMGHWDAWVRS